MVRTSAIALHETYARLEQNTRYAEDDPRYRLAVELPQQESINSLRVAEALTTDEPLEDEAEENLQDSAISEALRQISPDLHDRWHGALFALSPKNPDAARHFCSSAREIFTQVLQMKAPDDDVASALPDHQKDQRGKPTRRSRIHFLLHQRGMTDSTLEEFVEQDISNVIELFDVLNKGTHGAAGAFDLRTLLSIKTRVEQALGFVTELATSS